MTIKSIFFYKYIWTTRKKFGSLSIIVSEIEGWGLLKVKGIIYKWLSYHHFFIAMLSYLYLPVTKNKHVINIIFLYYTTKIFIVYSGIAGPIQNVKKDRTEI